MAGFACGLWLAFGVEPGEMARFAGYELVWVLLPGLLAYRALAGDPGGPLRQVAIGWALGYLLQILAFILASATGLDALLLVYPPVALAIGWLARPRAPADPQDAHSAPAPAEAGRSAPGWRWAVAGLCVVVLGLLAPLFNQTPLPGPNRSVNYNPDLVYDLSLAAEAKHHFPLEEPQIAGTALSYHTFPYFDMASVSRVTGLELPVVLFRMTIVPLVLLIALQLVWAGGALTGGRWLGLVAAVVALLLGELDLDPEFGARFAGWFASLVWGPNNHGFALGLVFFVPAVVLLCEWVASGRRVGARQWLLLALLLVGCAGAKGFAILPLLAAGLGLWVAWRYLAERRIAWRGVAAAAGTALLFALTLVVQYRGRDRSTTFNLFDEPSMKDANFLAEVLPDPPLLGELVTPTLMVVGVLGGLSAVVIGCVLALRRPGADRAGATLLVSLLVAGLMPLFLLSTPHTSHLWPMFYGAVAASLLAAPGLALLWATLRRRWSAGVLLAAGGGWLALLGLAAVVPPLTGFSLIQSHWSFLVYGALALSIVCLGLLWTGHAGRIAPVAAVPLAALVLASALDLPIDTLADLDGSRGLEPRGLTGDLHAGLRWVRRNTGPSDVLAVSNQTLQSDDSGAGYAYYAAFAERRVLIGGWDLVADRRQVVERGRLNRRIFDRADPRALRVATRDHGVTHLVVDKVHGQVSPAVARLGRRVYSNPGLDVYSVAGA